jgi:hypothetical protein
MADTQLQRARAAKEKLAKQLSGDADVVGVGLARVNGRIGVKVNLRELRPGKPGLPERVDDVPVRTEIVGRIRPRRARA